MPNEPRSFSNRRRFVRANIYAIARYVCPIRENAVEVQARISDISEGGLFLMTLQEKLPENALIKVSFVVPGAKGGFMTVAGKVKYTKMLEQDSYRSGIEFVGVEKKDLLAIREYVAAHPLK